jgi:DNA-binding NarL/FixJ family response regulator
MGKMAIRLLIADDQEIVRLGLKNMLEGSDIRIVAQAATGDQVLDLVKKHKPDVILMEARLPGTDGLQVLGRLKLDWADQRVIMFSAHENPRYLARAVALGAEGYLFKNARKDELIKAIRAAAVGEQTWSRSELRRVGAAMASPVASDTVDVSLTKRELEVLRQVATGATNRDIAKHLKISYETIKEHVQHVLRKIGVTDRTQAAVWAVRQRIV